MLQKRAIEKGDIYVAFGGNLRETMNVRKVARRKRSYIHPYRETRPWT